MITSMTRQKIAITRPRVRRTDEGGEVPLETYARLQAPEAMPEAVLRRMVRGVSTLHLCRGPSAACNHLPKDLANSDGDYFFSVRM